MLRTSFGLNEEADTVEEVVNNLLERGVRTPDLGGTIRTVEMGDAVATGIRAYASVAAD